MEYETFNANDGQIVLLAVAQKFQRHLRLKVHLIAGYMGGPAKKNRQKFMLRKHVVNTG